MTAQSRIVDPPIEDIQAGRLRTSLEPGEWRVLEFFSAHLPLEWEIYVQPHLNGLRPDFVLLNPSVGIGIFEVKDWNFRAVHYGLRLGVNGAFILEGESGTRGVFKTESPLSKAKRYRDAVINVLAPEIGVKCLPQLVTSGVIFTEGDRDEVHAVFGQQIDEFERDGPYRPVACRQDLDRGLLDKVFPQARWKSSKYPQTVKSACTSLRFWLTEPIVAKEQREPLPVDHDLQAWLRTPSTTGLKRLRGAAGTGKSLAIAHRAAELAQAGKQVLVCYFNITLGHYLHDLAVRSSFLKGARRCINDFVEFKHFHGWCHDVCFESGLEPEYLSLLQKVDQEPTEVRAVIFNTEIPDLVRKALSNFPPGESPAFDAILVDEGQDFTPEWWALLKQVRRPNCQMLLVADQTQNIYGRRAWTDDEMRGTGFHGRWKELRVGYRTPAALVPHLKRFADCYLDGDISLPEPAKQMELFPLNLLWSQVRSSDLARAVAAAVCQAPKLLSMHPADMCVVLPDHNIGLELLNQLDGSLECTHVFAKDQLQRRSLKCAFYKGAATVKACTYHSIKGFEFRAIILAVDSIKGAPQSDSAEEYTSNSDDRGKAKEVYIGLTRLLSRTEGSTLLVICSDQSFRETRLEGWTDIDLI